MSYEYIIDFSLVESPDIDACLLTTNVSDVLEPLGHHQGVLNLSLGEAS